MVFKLMINGREATFSAGGTGQKRFIQLEWISGNIYKRFRVSQTDLVIENKSINYRASIITREITDMNGFDYDVAEPDYSVLKTIKLGAPEQLLRSFGTNFQQYTNRIVLQTTIEHVGVVILDDYVRSNDEEFDGSRIQDMYDRNNTPEQIAAFGKNYDVYEELLLEQPFAASFDVQDETADGADDGQITVIDAWGGPNPLEYRITSGPSTTGWQASNVFSSLPDGIYTIRVRDDDGNTSGNFQVEVNAGP